MKMSKKWEWQKQIKRILIFIVVFALAFTTLDVRAVTYDYPGVQNDYEQLGYGNQVIYQWHYDTSEFCLYVWDVFFLTSELKDIPSDQCDRAILDKMDIRLFEMRPQLIAVDSELIELDIGGFCSQENMAEGYTITCYYKNGSSSIEYEIKAYVYDDLPPETETETQTEPETEEKPPIIELPDININDPLDDKDNHFKDKEIKGELLETEAETEREKPAAPVRPKIVVKPSPETESETETETETETESETEVETSSDESGDVTGGGTPGEGAEQPELVSAVNTENGMLEMIKEYAYLVSFGGGSIAAVLFGISITFDVKTLIWYQKKKAMMRKQFRNLRKAGR